MGGSPRPTKMYLGRGDLFSGRFKESRERPGFFIAIFFFITA